MFTLVPSRFFDPASEREALAEVCELKEGSKVEHLNIPEYDAVLIYDDGDGIGDSCPEIYNVLKALPECGEYNKILCSVKDGSVFLAIAQGKSLLLANSWSAPDFTTAEYYIFLAVKSLQINPEVSTICFLSELKPEEEMSLYRYFKAVMRV